MVKSLYLSSLIMTGLCPPEIHMVKSWPLGPQSLTAFGDRAFKEVIKVK